MDSPPAPENRSATATNLRSDFFSHLLALARLLDGVPKELDDTLRAKLPKGSPFLCRRPVPEAIEQRHRVIVVRPRLTTERRE